MIDDRLEENKKKFENDEKYSLELRKRAEKAAADEEAEEVCVCVCVCVCVYHVSSVLNVQFRPQSACVYVCVCVCVCVCGRV
jgi:hypothetical protein